LANLLYLVHRMPYPPNKGDKVRSYHLLRHLMARHRVFVGTFVDDLEDQPHVDTLRALCTSLHAVRLHPGRSRIGSLAGLLDGQALTLHYYRDAGLRRWVEETVRRESIDAVVVYSSSMAQYADGLGLPLLVDFVDLDSAKWTQYAELHAWPMSWLYRREGVHLLAYERALAARSACSFFVTRRETELLLRQAPECADLVDAMGNGVDAKFFAPDPARPSPFAEGELSVVFTGVMDYWRNIDAVSWFAQEMLPGLRERWPALRFHIVGRNPTPAVHALASDAVAVSGTVPDVRPYLQHAAVVVAPLRLARGLQNKILEAMAMGRPVVAARDCGGAIAAPAGAELLLADQAADPVREIDTLLLDPQRAAAVGAAGRRRVLQAYNWHAHLSSLDRHLAALPGTLAEVDLAPELELLA
jgi:sugar transferase (PEP-CTERM/EpsH1 system associated)